MLRKDEINIWTGLTKRISAPSCSYFISIETIIEKQEEEFVHNAAPFIGLK